MYSEIHILRNKILWYKLLSLIQLMLLFSVLLFNVIAYSIHSLIHTQFQSMGIFAVILPAKINGIETSDFKELLAYMLNNSGKLTMISISVITCSFILYPIIKYTKQRIGIFILNHHELNDRIIEELDVAFITYKDISKNIMLIALAIIVGIIIFQVTYYLDPSLNYINPELSGRPSFNEISRKIR